MIMALIYRNVPRKKTNELLLLGERISGRGGARGGDREPRGAGRRVRRGGGRLGGQAGVQVAGDDEARQGRHVPSAGHAASRTRSTTCARQLSIAFSTEDIQEGVKAFFEKRESELDRPLTMGVSLVALRCRTSDRTPRAVRGVETLAPLVGKRLGPRGARDREPVEARAAPLRRGPARLARLPARGGRPGGRRARRRQGAGAARRRLLDRASPRCRRRCGTARGSRCSGSTPTPTTTRPTTTTSGYLGGMALAGACGEWDAGLADTIASERVVLAGVRDLDAGERELLERSGGDRDRGEQRGDARGGEERARRRAGVRAPRPRRDRPRALPGAVPRAGRAAPGEALRPAEAVVEDCELVGLEITAFEAPDDPASTPRRRRPPCAWSSRSLTACRRSSE